MSDMKNDPFDLYDESFVKKSGNEEKIEEEVVQEETVVETARETFADSFVKIEETELEIDFAKLEKIAELNAEPIEDDSIKAGFLEAMMSDEDFKLDENSYIGEEQESKIGKTVAAAGEITSKLITKIEQTITEVAAATQVVEETLPTFNEDDDSALSVEIEDEDDLGVKMSKYQKVSIADEQDVSLEFDKIVSGLNISSQEVLSAVEVVKQEHEQEKLEAQAQQEQEANEQAVEDGEVQDSSVQDDEFKTQHFSLDEAVKQVDISGATRSFDLPLDQIDVKAQSELNKTRKNLMDNFRVLSTQDEDGTILENTTDNSPAGLFEDIDDDNCDDVFEAVEKLDNKKGKIDNIFAFGEKSIKAIQIKAKNELKKLSMKEAGQIKEDLKKEQSKLKTKLFGSVGLFALSLILLAIVMAYTPGGALEPLFANGARYLVAANLILTLGICVYLRDIIKSAVRSIKIFSPNINTSFLVIAFFVILDQIVLLCTGSLVEANAFVYTICVSFAGLVCVMSSISRVKTALDSLETITTGEKLVSLHPIDNDVDLDVLTGDKQSKKVLFKAPCEIPHAYNALTESKPLRSKYYAYVIMSVVLLSFVVGIITLFVAESSLAFVSSFVACVCAGLPFMQKYVVAKTNERVNARVNKDGSIIKGFTAMQNGGMSDSVCVDIDEICEAGVSQFKTIPNAQVSLNDAVVLTVCTLKAAKSIIAPCFDEFVSSLKFELPQVEDYEYVQHEGYKANVAGIDVAVCNRRMAEKLEVEGLPSIEQEEAYAKKSTVMYVIMQTQIIATFLVEYRATLASKDVMKEFVKTPLKLMIYSHEVSLDLAKIIKSLGIESTRVKILSENSEQIINEYRLNSTLKKESGLITKANNKNTLALVVAAHNLYQGDKIAGHLYFCGSIFSLILVAISVLINPTLPFNPLTIIALQVVWAGVSILLGARKG